jgi:hypothetical protein
MSVLSDVSLGNSANSNRYSTSYCSMLLVCCLKELLS